MLVNSTLDWVTFFSPIGLSESFVALLFVGTQSTKAIDNTNQLIKLFCDHIYLLSSLGMVFMPILYD
jgi:hypothetical protein